MAIFDARSNVFLVGIMICITVTRNANIPPLQYIFQERRTEAQVHKEKGNDFFKNQKYEDAIKSYSRALKLCPKDFIKDRSILFSNRAACKMKKASINMF